MPPFPERESSILAKLKRKKGPGNLPDIDDARRNVNGSTEHSENNEDTKKVNKLQCCYQLLRNLLHFILCVEFFCDMFAFTNSILSIWLFITTFQIIASSSHLICHFSAFPWSLSSLFSCSPICLHPPIFFLFLLSISHLHHWWQIFFIPTDPALPLLVVPSYSLLGPWYIYEYKSLMLWIFM